MKNLLFIIMLISSAAYAQEVSIAKVCTPYKVIDAKIKGYFSVDGAMYAVKVSKYVSIQKFDAKLAEVKRTEKLEPQKGWHYETTLKIKNNIYIFYWTWDKTKKLEKLFAQKVNLETCEFTEKPLNLITTGRVAWEMSDDMYIQNKFNVYISSDESRVMVQFKQSPKYKDNSKNKDVIGLYIFDSDLSEIHNKKHKMPHTEARMKIIEYAVDSEGNSYLISAIKKSSKSKYFHLELYKYIKNEELKATNIYYDNISVSKLMLYETASKLMICAGFYGKIESSKGSDGVIVFAINEDGELANKTKYEIPVEIMSKFEKSSKKNSNKRKDKKGKAEFEDLILKTVTTTTDGGLVLIGEQQYSTVNNSKVNNYFDDMLFVKITEEGKLAWMKKLPKRQKSASTFYDLSYSYFDGGNNHYVMYLDNIANVNLPEDKTPKVHISKAGGFLTSYIIDNNTGEVTKKPIFDVRKIGKISLYQFTPKRIVQIENNKFAAEAYKKGKQDVLIEIDL